MDGIQVNKMPLKQQALSLFSDDDLMRLSDGDLQGMCDMYFKGDAVKVYQILIKRRDKLLKPEDKRKLNNDYYHNVRKGRERRIELRLNRETEKDVIKWLDDQPNKTDAVVQLVRKQIKKGAK